MFFGIFEDTEIRVKTGENSSDDRGIIGDEMTSKLGLKISGENEHE